MHPDACLAARHFEALGTTCSLFTVGAAHDRMESVESWIRETGAMLTRFDAGSELSRFNASAGRWFRVSPDLDYLLRCSLEAFESSGGLVNVAVLESMVSIGYGRHFASGPTRVAIGEPRPLPPLASVLELRRGEARLAPGNGIDLGGIAKGWMADRARAMLGHNALANVGGDLAAGGAGPEGAGWPVGMGGSTVLLTDQAAATSSTRRRRWGDMHHLVDPRTGLPARTGIDEVSVVARTGFDAEVVAKTALLLGPDHAPAYCAAHALAWWMDGPHDG